MSPERPLAGAGGLVSTLVTLTARSLSLAKDPLRVRRANLAASVKIFLLFPHEHHRALSEPWTECGKLRVLVGFQGDVTSVGEAGRSGPLAVCSCLHRALYQRSLACSLSRGRAAGRRRGGRLARGNGQPLCDAFLLNLPWRPRK